MLSWLRFCLAAILQLPYILASDAIIAQGRIEQSSRLEAVTQSLRLICLLLAIPFGLSGFCWGLVVAGAGSAVVSHYFLHKIMGLRVADRGSLSAQCHRRHYLCYAGRHRRGICRPG